ALRRDGLSLRQIGAELARLGIRTRRGRANWSPSQIARLLRRAGIGQAEPAPAPTPAPAPVVSPPAPAPQPPASPARAPPPAPRPRPVIHRQAPQPVIPRGVSPAFNDHGRTGMEPGACSLTLA